ncbi:MAG: nitrogen regulation protein NR(II) [Terriglobia bacterium]
MDVASELTLLVAAKLIVYSLGALVHLFLMVLILGQRRLRQLEWLLFALMAALFMWNSGNLLALNVGLFYGVPPNILAGISRLIPFLGFVAAAPLVVHTQAEYAGRVHPWGRPMRFLLAAFYLPVIVAPWMVGKLVGRIELEPTIALGAFARPLVVWMVAALGCGAAIEFLLRGAAQDSGAVWFPTALAGLQGGLALGMLWEYLLRPLPIQGLGGPFAVLLMLVAVTPSALVGYSIFRHKFLELRVQRNLVYTIAAMFSLLIYLNVIRRLSGFLEARNVLPSAVTEGVMIFLLVIMLEPIKKQIDRLLHAAFIFEFERVQRLSAEIYEHAKRTGDVQSLQNFVAQRVARELSLERVELRLEPAGYGTPDSQPPSKMRLFPIHRGSDVIASLAVTPVTSDLSGDLDAALEVLAERMAGALELCQLIADKVELERALAQKARLAFLGEMAARIAHNVKNPLSSMKTLVQLMEEDTTLPERVRRDCQMVISEIDRLNGNISQVLRYAKPARDTDRAVDLTGVVGRVLSLARAEAERRKVSLEFDSAAGPCAVEGGEEAAGDIVSNLVFNALQASPAGAPVRVRVARESTSPEHVVLAVEDRGPGIAAEMKAKIFQPFFTTRPGGTGLGLAIVARRVEEIGGAVNCESPWDGGQSGARFLVRFRAAS